MCVADDDEWSGTASGGYDGGSVDTIQALGPITNINLGADPYAGVDWEEIHPALLDSLPGGFSGASVDPVIGELDLSLLEDLTVLPPLYGAQIP